MGRRKYRFRNRAEAERNWRQEHQGRLAAEWYATAMMQRRVQQVGRVKDGAHWVTVQYFTTNHSAFVVAKTDAATVHCIRGIWSVDDELLTRVVSSLMRYADSRRIGELIDQAKRDAMDALLAV